MKSGDIDHISRELACRDIGTTIGTDVIDIRIKSYTGLNQSAANELMIDIIKTLKKNLVGGHVTSNWGHDIEFEFFVGQPKTNLRLEDKDAV